MLSSETVVKIEHVSATEYLAGECAAELRHEYIDGEIIAMGGASRAHNLLVGNVHAALHRHLRGGPCRVLMTDMKVHIPSANAFYYPDLLVSCSAPEAEPDLYYESSPCLIIEVLSPSTEVRDRMEKRLNYQTLVSLEEYLLLAQDKIAVDLYRRVAGGWEHERYGVNSVLQLHSIDLPLPVIELYEGLTIR